MGEAMEKKKRNIFVPPMAEGYVRPKFSIAVRVVGGYVWEHDIDSAGFPTSALRPHYREGDAGYPEGGYPTPEEALASMLKPAPPSEAPEPTDKA